MIAEILVKVSFLKHTLIKSDAGIVEGDYNTTKLVFQFEEDVSGKRILFKMSNPAGELIFLQELVDNEILLVGKDADGYTCSLFPTYGLYPFELVLWGEESKLTSAPGWLNVSKSQVTVIDSVTTNYLPLFDKLLDDLGNTTLFLKFSPYPDGTDFSDTWEEGYSYIGIAAGTEAPTDKAEYKWAPYGGGGVTNLAIALGRGYNSLIHHNLLENKALSEYSSARGSKTVAGRKAFKIISQNASSRTYTLSGVPSTYAVGDTFSIEGALASSGSKKTYLEYSKISAVAGQAITVDDFVELNLASSTQAIFWVSTKYDDGDTELGTIASAEGCDTRALGQYSHTEGYRTKAYADRTHAEGSYTTALGLASHAEGQETKTSGQASHAEGYLTHASGSHSHSEGDNTKAIGQSSHAEGSACESQAAYAHAEGRLSIASNDGAHAEGRETTASGSYSHAEGRSTTASASYSHAEGNNSTASKEAAHAEGYKTTASGTYSHSEGHTTEASGNHSHAEGALTHATNSSSHAEGQETTASGEASHSEGYKTSATSQSAHVEGFYSIASGKHSHAEGDHTIAAGDCQHVQGKYNAEDTTKIYAHIVGGGTSESDRRNIHTLDWNGNAVYAGTVTASNFIGTVDAAKKDSKGNDLHKYIKAVSFSLSRLSYTYGDGTSGSISLPYADSANSNDGIITGKQSDVTISSGTITVKHAAEADKATTATKATTAGRAEKITSAQATSGGDRLVYFSGNNDLSLVEGQLSFKYNPETKVLSVPTVKGTADKAKLLDMGNFDPDHENAATFTLSGGVGSMGTDMPLELGGLYTVCLWDDVSECQYTGMFLNQFEGVSHCMSLGLYMLVIDYNGTKWNITVLDYKGTGTSITGEVNFFRIA